MNDVTWFKAVIHVFTTNDKGKQTKKSEEYLVKDASPTNVEAKLHKYMEGFSYDDYTIKSIAKTNIIDVLDK